MCGGSASRTSSQFVKRALDTACAAIGLLLLSPALAVVRGRDSNVVAGTGLRYCRTRKAKNGCPFEMLKFRTMVDGADEMRAELAELNEAGPGLFKIAEDPRITGVGRLLRRTSMDELPRSLLREVLIGDMSLAGPRPSIPD